MQASTTKSKDRNSCTDSEPSCCTLNVFFISPHFINFFSGEKSLPPQVGVLPLLSEDEAPWFAGILGIDDLVKTDPQRGQFLHKLQELATRKQTVLATFNESEENDDDLDSNSKFSKALEQLTVEHNGHEIKLDDLQLTFQYSPSSVIFGLEKVT